MKETKTFYVDRKEAPTMLAVLLLLGAIVSLCILTLQSGFAREHVFTVLLLSGAELLAVLLVLFQGQENFYRTAVPISLMCLFGVLPAFSAYARIPVYALIVLYACIALTYLLLVSGKVERTFFLPVLAAFALLALLAEGMPPHWQSLPLLFALSGIVMLCISMKEHEDGQYHRTWGDRPDGRLVRSLEPITYVGVYIMPNRNGASTLFKDTLDVTELDRYIHAKRRDDIPHLSLIQIFLTAYCRTVAEFPALNRFIAGEKIYTRDGEILFNITVKKKMTIDAPETIVKLHLTPEETLYTVSEKLDAVFREGKEEEDSDFDNTAALIRAIPGILKKFTIWLLKTMDFFGLLPAFLLEVSPFHGSIFFTSMASLGIPPIYHHLYDFGNMPVFLCMGDKYKKEVRKKDGTYEMRKFLKYTVNSDERICDGFYYSRGLKAFRRYLQHPELLEKPPETVKHDVP